MVILNWKQGKLCDKCLYLMVVVWSGRSYISNKKFETLHWKYTERSTFKNYSVLLIMFFFLFNSEPKITFSYVSPSIKCKGSKTIICASHLARHCVACCTEWRLVKKIFEKRFCSNTWMDRGKKLACPRHLKQKYYGCTVFQALTTDKSWWVKCFSVTMLTFEQPRTCTLRVFSVNNNYKLEKVIQ